MLVAARLPSPGRLGPQAYSVSSAVGPHKLYLASGPASGQRTGLPPLNAGRAGCTDISLYRRRRGQQAAVVDGDSKLADGDSVEQVCLSIIFKFCTSKLT